MKNTVIFDMDGVICHTNPTHSVAFKVFFEKRGMFPTEAEFGEHMYGKSNSYIFSHFFDRPVAGEELLAYEDEKESLFRELYAEKIEPIAGFMPWLEYLHESGVKLGVATSAPRANMDLILCGLDIADIFSSKLASEDVDKHKPDPQVYLRSAERLSAEPTECLVFEDSHAGVSAGIAANMEVVGVLSSHTAEELPPCKAYVERYEIELLAGIMGIEK